MKITRDEVIKAADLARLELTENEIKSFCSQLDEILTYFDKLNEIDTKDVKIMSHILPLKNVEREDKKEDSDLSVDSLMEIAPESRDGFVVVPRVINSRVNE